MRMRIHALVQHSVVALSLVLGSTEVAHAKSKAKPVVRAGEHAGVLVVLNGAATIENGTRKLPAKIGMDLVGGDTVVTGEGSKCKLLLDDDTTINIGANSRFAIDKVNVREGEREISLRIVSGKFMAAVAQWFGPKSQFEVTTPTAVAGIRGTVLWGDTAMDAICALHGKIEVKAKTGGAPVELSAGQCAAKMGEGKTDPLQPTGEQVKAYLAEVMAQR